MKRSTGGVRERTWVVDYSAARTRAIKWLGDRYLLARPINVSESAWRRAPQSAPGTVSSTGRSW
jgi:hypothetical protein